MSAAGRHRHPRSVGWSPDRPERVLLEPPTAFAPGERRLVISFGSGLHVEELPRALEQAAAVLRASNLGGPR